VLISVSKHSSQTTFLNDPTPAKPVVLMHYIAGHTLLGAATVAYDRIECRDSRCKWQQQSYRYFQHV
jgi:hypothetical protein